MAGISANRGRTRSYLAVFALVTIVGLSGCSSSVMPATAQFRSAADDICSRADHIASVKAKAARQAGDPAATFQALYDSQSQAVRELRALRGPADLKAGVMEATTVVSRGLPSARRGIAATRGALSAGPNSAEGNRDTAVSAAALQRADAYNRSAAAIFRRLEMSACAKFIS